MYLEIWMSDLKQDQASRKPILNTYIFMNKKYQYTQSIELVS